MKKILLSSLFIFSLLFVFLLQKDDAQIANAGADLHIYLSQTSTVVLNGSKSLGTKYRWSDISTDYPSPAKIVSPTSKTTTLRGLKQGLFYYQLAVIKGSKTVYDTVKISVDFDKPPAKSFLIRDFPLQSIYSIVNDRHDTTNYIETKWSEDGKDIFFDRSRLNDEFIDPEKGKFYSTIEDGYGWNGNDYARSEIHYGSYYRLDSNKTYAFEWKGYFKDDFSHVMAPSQSSQVTIIMQIHGNDSKSPPFQFQARAGTDIDFVGSNSITKILALSSLVNQTHTITLTIREGKGYSGQDAFVKVEVDGIQKYYRNTGQVGQTLQQDYPKFATMYDWGNALVDPRKKARGRRFSLVTESFRIYQIEDKLRENHF